MPCQLIWILMMTRQLPHLHHRGTTITIIDTLTMMKHRHRHPHRLHQALQWIRLLVTLTKRMMHPRPAHQQRLSLIQMVQRAD